MWSDRQGADPPIRTRCGRVAIACGLLMIAGSVPLRGSVGSQNAAPSGPVARFAFDGSIDNTTETSVAVAARGAVAFVAGLDGEALRVRSTGAPAPASGSSPPAPLATISRAPTASPALLTVATENLPFDRGDDFSVQYWLRTTADPDRRMVVVSRKAFADNNLASQKQPGWVSYISDGTWAWNVGSGDRRLTYERDNGKHMPINDGRWHQITMTYDHARSEVRLYYDGRNRAVYNVADAVGFDFATSAPLTIGWDGTAARPAAERIVAAIYAGAETLQALVDAFDEFGLDAVAPDELVNLIVEPERFFEQKVEAAAGRLGADGAALRESMQSVEFQPIKTVEAELMNNPYTIHQAFSFMEAAPLLKIYSLIDGRIVIGEAAARAFTERERLYPSDFDIDNLAVWDRPLAADEVLDAYAEHFEPVVPDLEETMTAFTAGAWNIFHGGKHFTVDEHGWDSRVAIAEILRREDVDVVMMQETYSSGDFVAAELGYYFATTVDWDYLNQGANISVLSRYPIEEVYVQEDSPFMTVAAKIAISRTQHLYAMSNWYGMDQFPAVFAFNEPRFAESAVIPTLFGGDFNAVPHIDGGDSPASPVMLEAGFTDAYRSLHPDVQAYPGATHRNGRRIDQLYYKGAALRNTSTRLVTTWPTGFPSDHNLILARFEIR